jgi:hypothetical protein
MFYQAQRPFADALRMELAAAGDNLRALRAIARNLIAIASSVAKFGRTLASGAFIRITPDPLLARTLLP